MDKLQDTGNDLAKSYTYHKSKLNGVIAKIDKRFDWLIKNRFDYLPNYFSELWEKDNSLFLSHKQKLKIIQITEYNYNKSNSKQLSFS